MVDKYVVARSIQEAIETLSIEDRSLAVIAGGTDLLLDIQQGRHSQPDILLDVSEIEEMRHIRQDNDMLYLGGAVTHNEIIRSALLQEHAQCVVEGCGLIGGPQVRNVATIGGNVAHGLPAGDGTISLLALNAEVRIDSLSGESRWEPLVDIFAGPGEVTFDRRRELLIGFRFSVKGESRRICIPPGYATSRGSHSHLEYGCLGEIRSKQAFQGPPYLVRSCRTETIPGLSNRGCFQEQAVR